MNAIISLSILCLATLFSGLYKAKKLIMPLGVIGIIAAIALITSEWNSSQSYYNHMITIDNYAIVFSVLMCVVAGLILLLIVDEKEEIDFPLAETSGLMIAALIGALCMVSFTNMSMLFLGIEILSICMYVLAGAKKRNFASNEAALKYYLMGAFATGILLFGIALVYGASGSFDTTVIANYVANSTEGIPSIFYVGILLILVGMSFKVAAAPFHFWTPDVYTGAPTLVTAYMSTVVKIAAIAAFYRLFNACFLNVSEFWSFILVIMAALTLLIGNISAAVQSSYKRMLAFSSVAHAGYLLFALFAMGKTSASAILIYTVAYAFASILAFTGLVVVQHHTQETDFEKFNGLAKRNPLLAFCITVGMLSLAGIPPLAGFMGKFSIFSAATSQNYVWITLWAVLMSCVGIYYYFKVIIAMYMKPAADDTKYELTPIQQIVFAIALALTILLGILPNFTASLLQ